MASLKAFVNFVCERLSLAVVAICSVFMVLIFVTVEVNATHVSSYPVHFEGNTDRVQMQSGAPVGADALQTGDRVEPP